jgi:C4-dicarboxylate-specific signal transduction histidine kinase
MDNYKAMYYILFNAITNAIEAQADSNYETAMKILIKAQQNAEEVFISGQK